MTTYRELREHLDRVPRWVFALAALAPVVVLAVVLALRLVPAGAMTPQQAALEVCGLAGTTPGERWSGSGDDRQAQLRCTPDDASADALAERLRGLGYESVEQRAPVTDYQGNTDAWVVSAHHGPHPDVSVAGRPGRTDVDVVVGGSLHVHDDGEVHHHGPDDPPG